jgi:hypothetical protein
LTACVPHHRRFHGAAHRACPQVEACNVRHPLPEVLHVSGRLEAVVLGIFSAIARLPHADVEKWFHYHRGHPSLVITFKMKKLHERPIKNIPTYARQNVAATPVA